MKVLAELSLTLLLGGLTAAAPPATYGGAVSAVTTFTAAPSDRFCKENGRAIAWLEQRYGTSIVYSYCSSLLHIPPVTKTVTAGVATAVVTVTRATTVATTTPVSDVTQTSTSITYVRRNQASPSSRAATAPGPLKTYGDAIKSAACSCISSQIPRSTMTVTATVTVRATATKLESKTATASITATRVRTVLATCTAAANIKDGDFEQALTYWDAYFDGNGTGFVGQQFGYEGYGLHIEAGGITNSSYTVGFVQNVTTCRGARYNVNFARLLTGDQHAGSDCVFGVSFDGFASYVYQDKLYSPLYGYGRDGVNNTYDAWQFASKSNVVATSTVSKLGFALVCPPSQSAGVTVDNVYLQPY